MTSLRDFRRAALPAMALGLLSATFSQADNARREKLYRFTDQGGIVSLSNLPHLDKRYGVKDLFDPRDNVAGGAKYLRDLLELFENNLELALAGYNAGEGSVIRAGHRIPNYRETLAYVPKVLDFYRAARNTDAWP